MTDQATDTTPVVPNDNSEAVAPEVVTITPAVQPHQELAPEVNKVPEAETEVKEVKTEPVVEPTKPEIKPETKPVDKPEAAKFVPEGTPPDAMIVGDIIVGDVSLQVTVPPELQELFKDTDVDLKSITKELYGSKDFSLSTESLEQLYGVLGKFQTDNYILGLEARSKQTISEIRTNQRESKEANQKAWDDTKETFNVKTDEEATEVWTKLSGFALETLSDTELKNFNDAMKNADSYVQQVLIKNLFSQYQNKTPEVDKSLNLEDGTTSMQINSSDAYTFKEYQEAMLLPDYNQNRAFHKAKREEGMRRGI